MTGFFRPTKPRSLITPLTFRKQRPQTPSSRSLTFQDGHDDKQLVGLGDHGRGRRPVGGGLLGGRGARVSGGQPATPGRAPGEAPAARPRPGHPDPARRSASSAPGPPVHPQPRPDSRQKPVGHPARPVLRETRARRQRTFCRLLKSFSNTPAAAAAAAAVPRFRLATRPAGPVPRGGWRTKGDRDQGSRG